MRGTSSVSGEVLCGKKTLVGSLWAVPAILKTLFFKVTGCLPMYGLAVDLLGSHDRVQVKEL